MNGEDECELPGIIDIQEDDTNLSKIEFATELYNTDNITDISGAFNHNSLCLKKLFFINTNINFIF